MLDIRGQTLLNRYYIQSLVGRGGMADVYQARDLENGRNLALKVLKPELAQDPLFLDSFRREAQNLSLLQHPNIVRCYGMEEQAGLFFLLMDFVDGGNLQNEILETVGIGISPQRALEILRPICYALTYAHEHSLVHCDIKPTNVLYDKDQQWLLSDFGIARLVGESQSILAGVGTPIYMSPEQIAAEKISPQADIFSVGVLLFEMLSGGVRPFTGEHCAAKLTEKEKIRWEHLNLKTPSLRKFKAGISIEIENVVKRCLQKSPDQRYHSMLDLLNALETAIASLPTSSWELPLSIEQKPREEKDETVAPPTDPFGNKAALEKEKSRQGLHVHSLGKRGFRLIAVIIILALILLVGSAFLMNWLPPGILSMSQAAFGSSLAQSSLIQSTDSQIAVAIVTPSLKAALGEGQISSGQFIQILAVDGEVFYLDADRNASTLKIGETILLSNDTRVWSSNGKAKISFSNGAMIYLGEYTTVIYRSLPGGGQEPKLGIRLERGSILVETQAEPMTVESGLNLYWGGPEDKSLSGIVYDPIQEYFWVDCLYGNCLLSYGVNLTQVPAGTRAGYGKDILQNPSEPADQYWISLAGDGLRLPYKTPMPTNTPTPTIPPSAILYSEDFESGQAKNWKSSVGTWSIMQDGANHFWDGTGPDNYPQVWLKVDTTSWTDYAFESQIRIIRGSVFICVRSDNGGNSFYNAYLSSNDDWTSFAYYNGKKYVTFGDKPFPISQNRWYTVRFEVQGDQLRLYIDGKLITFANRYSLSSGGIGYYMGGGDEIQIDNIKVWLLTP